MRGTKTLIVAACAAGGLFLGSLPVEARQAQTRPAATQTQPAATFDPAKSDAKAVKIAEEVIAALGGDAWKKTRYVKFTWIWQQGEKSTSITHYWDRIGQRSRMEGPSKDGRPVIAYVDHTTKTGGAAIEGTELEGEEAQKYVDIAYSRLINDAYWFFMPYKILDPGVRLRYEGEVKAGPTTIYDKVLVMFEESVGLTPGDRYWLYVDRATHVPKSWSYILQGYPANASPVAWDWVDWETVGGLKIATRKTQPGGESQIRVENLKVFDSLPEAVFASTEPYGQTDSPVAASQPATP